MIQSGSYDLSGKLLFAEFKDLTFVGLTVHRYAAKVNVSASHFQPFYLGQHVPRGFDGVLVDFNQIDVGCSFVSLQFAIGIQGLSEPEQMKFKQLRESKGKRSTVACGQYFETY